jgi:hypothetical protein
MTSVVTETISRETETTSHETLTLILSKDESEKKKNEAEEALLTLSTIGRDVDQEEMDKLVQTILSDVDRRELLPALVFYIRNHHKSTVTKNGGASGLGEKKIAEKLIVSLYHCDQDAAITLVHHLVSYGYFGSLTSILDLTTELSFNMETDYYLPLWERIYDIFIIQLLHDNDEAVKRNPVSNASKYAPHENRKKGTNKKKKKDSKFYPHATKFVHKLFEDEQFRSNFPKKMKTGDKKKEYRKLRSKLNMHNGHIAERYLSMGNADNMDMENICASAFMRLNKALLNLDKKGKQRSKDESRINLAKRISESVKTNPDKIPVPSNMNDLATRLLSLDDESDESEKILLESSYQKTVKTLKRDFVKKVKNGLKLIKSLLDGQDLEYEKKDLILSLKQRLKESICQSILLIDCTVSQKDTLSTSLLMAMLLADVERELENKYDKELFVELFTLRSRSVLIPVNKENSSERLKKLLQEARKMPRSNDGAFEDTGNAAATANYANVLNSVSDTDRNIVICSDFSDSDSFSESVKEWKSKNSEKTLSCWRFLKSSRRTRKRKINFDPKNPVLDICIVMDTTGSMGQWIRHAKERVVELLNTLSSSCGMTVNASLVSYKDFGDDRHLEIHGWVSTDNQESLTEMVEFIETLRPSGGGDTPEDVAGGLEEAFPLFEGRKNSLKAVLLIADAPAHGFYGNGDSYPTYLDVDQKKRTLNIVNKISDAGVEIMFAECGFGAENKSMIESFDNLLMPKGTFIDYFSVSSTTSEVFGEKIKECMESFVSNAIVPPDDLGIDTFAGTDLGVPLLIASSRFSDDLLKLSYGKEEEPTAFDLIKLKLESETYDPVRATMSTLDKGFYKDFEFKQRLSFAAIDSLIKSGVTLDDLRSNGYPSVIVDQYEERIAGLLAQR